MKIKVTRRTVLLFTLLLVCIPLYYTASLFLATPRDKVVVWVSERDNQLFLGKEALVQGEVSIAVEPPQEFDGMSKQEVLTLRQKSVKKASDFIRSDYQPSSVAFGQIQDGLPWWGMHGEYFYGRGLLSSEGPSEESRLILNPLLLFEVYFNSPSIWHKYFAWKVKDIPITMLENKTLPLTCHPEEMVWRADEARAVVRYNVTAWLKELNHWIVEPWSSKDVWMELMGINARDMGLNWAYPDLSQSQNISKKNAPDEPWRLLDFIHRGGSCGIAGGCNNGSPLQEPLDNYHITGLPARFVVLLWDEKPAGISTPPNFLWEIEFK